MVGVVDCNNFYASCERVFHPELHQRPVIVLSNNDGCVIARSEEAKHMGIKMGVPFFEVKHFVDDCKLYACSSNYVLYGDMSHRVMSIVRQSVPCMEIYSIDETFIDLSGIADPHQIGIELVFRIGRWTGIPVSVGLATTKTLAKMASKFAKRYAGYHGCCLMDTEEKRIKALQLCPIHDVWGVGRHMVVQMNYYGVKTAYDFVRWPRQRVSREFGVDGVRTWLELQGCSCRPFGPAIAKKSITTSRSFKSPITTMAELQPLVADFAAHCARKLREQKGYALTLYVFFQTGYHQNSYNAKVVFDVPTSDVRELIKGATEGLRTIFFPGLGCKQAGVTVTDIVEGAVQTDIYDTVDRIKQQRLLKTMDEIHKRFGNRSLTIAAQGDCSGMVNRKYCSPCFTTDIRDIIKVKIY